MSTPLKYGMAVQSEAARGWFQTCLIRMGRAVRLQSPSERRLQRLETLALGPRKSVHLIRCDDRYFLVADGPGSILSIEAKRETASISEAER